MHHRIIAALFLLSPIIVITNLPYPYTLPRWVFLTILCFIWSVTLIFDQSQKKADLAFSPIDWAFIIFVATVGISTLTSVDILHSLWGSLERSFAFSFWLTLLIGFFGLKIALSKQEQKKFLLRFLVTTLFIAALWGFLQKIIPGFSQTFSGNRIGGTLGNAIFYGSYLTLSLGLLLFSFITEKKYSPWWIFSIISGLLATTSLFFTQTRGPLLGLLVGVCITATAYIYKTTSHKRSTLFGIVFLILISMGVGVITYNKQIFTQSTITTRLLNWQMAWDGFKDKPIFGWGPENYNLASDKYFVSSLTNYSIDETHADKPHNYFLELAITTGLIGLVAYLAILIASVAAIQKAEFSAIQSSLLLGILAASVTQNITAFETQGTAILFVFILAIISTAQKNKPSPKTSLLTLSALSLSSLLIIIFGVAPILRDATTYLQLIRLDSNYATTHELTTAIKQKLQTTPFPRDYFNALSFGIVGQYQQNPAGFASLTQNEKILHAEDAQWLRGAIADLNNTYTSNGAWKSALANSSYQLFSLTQDSADSVIAEKIISEYTRIAPNRQEPLMQLGQLNLMKNTPDKALEYFDQAIKLDSKLQTPRWQRTLALFSLKKYSLAWEELLYLMSNNYSFSSPQIANYIYNQLLNNAMATEAEQFRTYFESYSF
jgi:O-antigen ligase